MWKLVFFFFNFLIWGLLWVFSGKFSFFAVLLGLQLANSRPDYICPWAQTPSQIIITLFIFFWVNFIPSSRHPDRPELSGKLSASLFNHKRPRLQSKPAKASDNCRQIMALNCIPLFQKRVIFLLCIVIICFLSYIHIKLRQKGLKI